MQLNQQDPAYEGFDGALTAECLIGNGDLPVTVTLVYSDSIVDDGKVAYQGVDITDAMNDAHWKDIERSFEIRWLSIVASNRQS